MCDTKHDIVDAEFRVISRSLWAGWMAQLQNQGDRIAFTLNLAAVLVCLGGLLLGFMHLAFLLSAALATAAALASVEYKHYSLFGIALVALLATSGCSQQVAAPTRDRAMLAGEKAKTPEEVQASIRAATRYQDPRRGWKPNGIDIQGGQVMPKARSEADNAAR